MANKQTELDTDEPEPKKGRGKALSDDERVQILSWAKVDTPISEIARNLGRSRQCIHAFLSGIKATGHLAKLEAEAAIAQEARVLRARIVKDANPTEAMEYLHRHKVVEKPADAHGGHSQFIVMVGMPGQPALVPPSQAEIVTVQTRRLAEKTE